MSELGVIASPPCQAFSQGGLGAGREALDIFLAQVARMVAGHPVERGLLEEMCHDERAYLVLEPLRYVLALRPAWCAFEQVEPVLPLWEEMARGLRRVGYHVWTGVLRAEQYGVPQTRRRAILLARRDGPVEPPPPTHARYVPPRTVDEASMSLFAAPEPERIVAPEDRDLLPWVSMADALGWPGGRVVNTRGDRKTSGGNDFDPAGPSWALTEKARSWLVYDSRGQRDGRTKRPNRMRRADEPAPTVAGESRNDTWTTERPATTVQGDARIWPPGHKVNADDVAAGRLDYGDRAGTDAIRVSVEEAAALQTFPQGYPWHGSRSSRFLQVGNAVPPVLALAVLRMLEPLPALDLFAGPGGWDVAAEEVLPHVLGIEWDDDAVATRRAAGHPTLQADVAALDPLEVAKHLPRGPLADVA